MAEELRSGPSPVNLLTFRAGRRLDPPPPPPQDPGMEQRVAKLETDVGEIKEILKRLEPALTKLTVDVAEVKGKVSQMPTMWQLAALIVGIFGLAFTLLRFGLSGH